jgi:hypothetical protein
MFVNVYVHKDIILWYKLYILDTEKRSKSSWKKNLKSFAETMHWFGISKMQK